MQQINFTTVLKYCSSTTEYWKMEINLEMPSSLHDSDDLGLNGGGAGIRVVDNHNNTIENHFESSKEEEKWG